jgi:hypothetical protein
MKPQYALDFASPADGLDSEPIFNTFRIGRVWAARLHENDNVFLMDAKTKLVFGEAYVEDVMTGKLGELARQHARFNHNQIGKPDELGAANRLIANLTKRFGPHIVNENKLTTVIYLSRVEWPNSK